MNALFFILDMCTPWCYNIYRHSVSIQSNTSQQTTKKKDGANMKIEPNKLYSVIKYDLQHDTTNNYGTMTGADVKSVIGTAKYDSDYGMWFTPRANIGYDIQPQ